MAKQFRISVAVCNTVVDAVVDRLDTGTGTARLEVRAGTVPAAMTSASGGTLLATLQFSATAFGTAGTPTARQANANAISSATAVASGDASFFRVYKGAAADTAAEWQGTAGNSGDTPDMIFDNKSIVSGGTVAVNSFSVTMPDV